MLIFIIICEYIGISQGYQLPPGIFRGPSGSSTANPNPASIQAKVAAAAAGGGGGGASRGAPPASQGQPPQAVAQKQKKPAAPKAEKSLPDNPQVHRDQAYEILYLIPPFSDKAPGAAAE